LKKIKGNLFFPPMEAFSIFPLTFDIQF
jgi:hypothetical protein